MSKEGIHLSASIATLIAFAMALPSLLNVLSPWASVVCVAFACAGLVISARWKLLRLSLLWQLMCIALMLVSVGIWTYSYLRYELALLPKDREWHISVIRGDAPPPQLPTPDEIRQDERKRISDERRAIVERWIEWSLIQGWFVAAGLWGFAVVYSLRHPTTTK